MLHESLSDGHSALRFGLNTVSVKKDGRLNLTLTIRSDQNPVVGLSLNLMEQTKSVQQKLLRLRKSLKSASDNKQTKNEVHNQTDTITASIVLIFGYIVVVFCS